MLSKQMEQMMFMTQQQIVQQFQFQERIFMFLLKQQQPWPAVGLGSGQITNVSKPLEMYYLERFSEMQGNSLSVSLQGMYTVNIFLLNESLSLSLSHRLAQTPCRSHPPTRRTSLSYPACRGLTSFVHDL